MIETIHDKRAFDSYIERILEINEHYEGCHFHNRSIPIDECTCNCYNKQIFKLGMEEQKRQFYET